MKCVDVRSRAPRHELAGDIFRNAERNIFKSRHPGVFDCAKLCNQPLIRNGADFVEMRERDKIRERHVGLL